MGERFGRVTAQAVSQTVANLGEELTTNRPLARMIRQCEARVNDNL